MKVLLFSGGLDSSALLASRKDIGMCLFVDYGQTQAENERAAVNAQAFNVHVLSVSIPGEAFPHTFNLPGRNTILATLGAALAKENGLDGVIMGINADDHDCYPDCRPAWVDAMNEVLRLSELPGLEAPFLHLSKAEILKVAQASGLDVSSTTSCYNGSDCGHCGACEVRAKCLG